VLQKVCNPPKPDYSKLGRNREHAQMLLAVAREVQQDTLALGEDAVIRMAKAQD